MKVSFHDAAPSDRCSFNALSRRDADGLFVGPGGALCPRCLRCLAAIFEEKDWPTPPPAGAALRGLHRPIAGCAFCQSGPDGRRRFVVGPTAAVCEVCAWRLSRMMAAAEEPGQDA
jgi:hypothetical protein